MKWFSVKVLLVFIVCASSYGITWAEVPGCYQTVVYNDSYLENSANNYSVINLNENPLFFISVDEEEYIVHSAVIYKGNTHYHYQDIYFEDGATSNNSGFLRSDFKAYVRYRFSPEKVLKLSNQFSIRHIDGNTYEVVAFQNIDFEGKSYLESGRFVLEKIDCYDDIATEEIFSRGIELPFELEL